MLAEIELISGNKVCNKLKASTDVKKHEIEQTIINVIKHYYISDDTPEVILIDLRDSEKKNNTPAIESADFYAETFNLSVHMQREKCTQEKKPPQIDTPHLTKRETEVLEFIAKGLSYNEIANALYMSSHTVTSHVKNIFKKLSVRSRGEAAFEAVQLGLINIHH